MRIEPSEHAARIARLQERLRADGLDGALLVQGTDVFYFSGTRQNAVVWVPGEGAPVLLVRRSLARAREDTPLDDVRPFASPRELPAVAGGARRVGFTFDVAPVALQQLYLRTLPGVELVDVSAVVRQQRSVKSPAEVARIRAAAAVLCAGLREVRAFLRAGATELEISAEIEYRMRRAGNEGSPRCRGFNQELYSGLVVAGRNAAAPGFFDGPVTGRGLSAAAPLGASSAEVGRDEPVLLDFTAVRGGYVADMTRVAVCGRLPGEVRDAFAVALAIQDEVTRALRPGTLPSDLWARARQRAEAAGLGDRFMGAPGAQARFVGHGVGLELDELPVLAPGFDAPLVAGQTIAIEPKFVLPGVGAVGIENTWAVAEAGGVRLTELDDAVIEV